MNLLEYVESCDRDSFTLPDFYSNIPQNAHIYFCMKIQIIPGKREVLNIHQNRSKIWITGKWAEAFGYLFIENVC